ncbi:acyl-CoA dehydrogenase family protein [Streptomyces sp. NRRL WC-3744]|uniref:acyl-CoA dehydrogenase family protein n=1 Tax=Streptomyces sp. NRRL WC-3744 TaxID=1463935 RepID=UPI0004C916EF|nr:acyl-CoA dehydrogenase family protein [Streptomyces sp. NRRL WC-3744]
MNDTALSGSSADLVERARGLAALLREHADEADRGGRLPEAVATALRDAGFLSLQVPRALGGPGADFRTAFDVYTELGRGCGSSGWLAMVLSGGSYMASLLGERARQELWGADAGAVVASRLPAAGTGRVTEGGLVVSGRWSPTSGVHHSEWVMVAVAAGDDTDLALAVVPTTAGSVDDTWDVTGLRATGSDTFVLDEVFVPDHRVLSLTRMMAGGYAEDHPDEPLCAAAVVPALTVTLVAPLLGMGLAALEHTREQLGASARRAGSAGVRYAVADAAASIDSARLLLLRALDDVEAGIARRARPGELVSARIHMDAALAARYLREAVRHLLTALGSAAFSTGCPVQRIWRDMEVALSHANIVPDPNREAYGRALLDLADAEAG